MVTVCRQPALDRTELLAAPVVEALTGLPPDARRDIEVAEIDDAFADTAAFCETYGVALDESANCVIVSGRRGETTRYAACLVLATTRVDVNGLVRRRLDVRKASFAPRATAVELTSMEFGGITPIGLPSDWQVLIDPAVAAAPMVVIGSGMRRSKLWTPGPVLAALPGVEVLAGLGVPIAG